ncbi:MAG TPA: acyl-CoA dehydrogenase family protein [Solirubrobacteraceae bacterium]|nr:acyl-CoA dehydrogenase family protein [Solirubrobacteraceae bacterium]
MTITAIRSDARALVPALADRAEEAEQLRRLPDETIADYERSGLGRLLMPARYGGEQAEFGAILELIRELAHGCTASAWTLGFYTLHNWMLSLFGEQAQEEVFGAGRPVRAPAPLAPTGRGIPADGGLRLTGRWSWATGIMHAEWVLVGALVGPDDRIVPALVLLGADEVRVEDTWQTEGMRATGSADVTVDDVFVPAHRIVAIPDIYAGTAPGATLHDAALYRWPMVPALALSAAMPALGTAERVAELYAGRLHDRVLADGSGKQRDKSAAQARLAEAEVRLAACRALVGATAREVQGLLDDGERPRRLHRARARLAAAHTVAESRRVIALLLEASGGSAHFLSSPLQRAKRDVDTLAGHVIFDYDTSRELAGALAIGLLISPTAMV